MESLEDRRVLAWGGLITDTIFPAGDVDGHFFTITEDDLAAAGGSYIVTLSLSDDYVGFRPLATLYSPTGDQFGRLNAGEKRVYELDEPGTYGVEVRDSDDRDTGDYALDLEGLNPTSTDAVAISLGDVTTGILLPGEIHELTFTAAAGDVLTVALAETDSDLAGFHPRAELYHSSSGERITLSSASTGGAARELSSGEKYVSQPLARSGLYVVQVYDDNYNDAHERGYAITVEGLSPPSEDAVWIALGEAVSGSIDVGEIDEYRFVGSSGDLVTISLSDVQAGSGNRLWAELYAPSGVKVDKLPSTSGPDEVENGEKVIFRLPEASSDTDPYVIQVYDNNYTDTEEYAIALEGLAPVSLDAAPIAIGDTLPGTIDAMGEVDAYYFTVSDTELTEGGGSYQVRVVFQSETTVDYRPLAVVYAPTGMEIADVGPGQNTLLTLTSAGTYVIQIHDMDFTHSAQQLIARGEIPDYSLRLLDAQRPRVRSVTVSDTLLADADAGSVFAVTVVFNESMNMAATPVLVFNPSVAGSSGATLIHPSSGSWSATNVTADTFTIEYEIADQNVDVASVKVGVTGAKDAAGNAQQTYTAEPEFEIDTLNPAVLSLSPADNATRVAWDSNLTMTFKEPIQKKSGDLVIRRSGDGSAVETVAVAGDRVTVSGAKVTIDPQAILEPSTSYYVEVSNGAFADLAGNDSVGIVGATIWNFTTISIPGVHQPFVAHPLRDLSFMVGRLQYDVDLVGVFDDLDIPLGDSLTLGFDNGADNTSSQLVTGELDGTTLRLTFTAEAVGRADLTVHASDLDGQVASDTFAVFVLSAPVAVDDIVTTDEDVPLEIAVYVNDTDADGTPVPNTVALVPGSGPTSGTIILDKGVFTYTPPANFFGSDSFRYIIRDDDGFFSNEATVSITVKEVADYHNAAVRGDVNNSGGVSPQDVLITINYINAVGFDLPPDPIPPARPLYFYDVDGDGAVTPNDVIEIINILNDAARGSGEGEAVAVGDAVLPMFAPSASSVALVSAPGLPAAAEEPSPVQDEVPRLEASGGCQRLDSREIVFRSLALDADAEIELLFDDLLSVLPATA